MIRVQAEEALAIHSSGGNFEIDIAGNLIKCRVWRRRDLSREEGARCGEQMTSDLMSLAKGPQGDDAGFIFDLREAPPAGPITQRSIERLLSTFEEKGRRIALVSAPDPLQLMQLRRMSASSAPTSSKVFTELSEAQAWAVPAAHP